MLVMNSRLSWISLNFESSSLIEVSARQPLLGIGDLAFQRRNVHLHGLKLGRRPVQYRQPGIEIRALLRQVSAFEWSP